MTRVRFMTTAKAHRQKMARKREERSQPHILPALPTTRYSGAHLRDIRAVKGAGRPPQRLA